MLRVETVINNPEEFRVRRQVRRNGKDMMAWVPLRKSVTLLFRYGEVSVQSNQSNVRYLDALSQVQDPTPARAKPRCPDHHRVDKRWQDGQALQSVVAQRTDALRGAPGR